jgi:membrane-associated phospholipid phosphatase
MKNLLLVLVLFLAIKVASQNATKTMDRNHFQTAAYVFKTSFKTIPSDFVFLGKEFSDDWKKTGYYAAGILGLIASDKITTKAWKNYVEPNIQYTLPAITPEFLKGSKNLWIVGENAYLTYPIMGLYFGSLFANSEKGQFVGINAFKAIAYSTLITQITLKTVLGRNRPFPRTNTSINYDPSYFTNNNWDFFNNRNGTYIYGHPSGSAMPSMHVTTYFALAKVIQMEYDNYWIPYGIMSVVFLNHIDGHQHWFSDMVFGGLVGTLIGRSIVRSSWKSRGVLDKKERKISLNYIPQFSTQFTGLKIIANIE